MKQIKALLLALVITTGTFATTDSNYINSKEIECNMIIRMFYFSLELDGPITDEQLAVGIDACKDIERHKEFVAEMQHMLDTTYEM